MEHNLWRQAVEKSRGLLSADEETRYGSSQPSDIVDDLKNITSDRADNSKLQWFLEKIQPLVDTLQRFGGAMDVFVSAAPEILSPLWGGLRVVLVLAKDAGSYFSKLLDMLQSLGDALPRFKAYEKLFPDHEPLQKAVLSVYLSVIGFLGEAKQVFSGSSFKLLRRFLWRSFDETFQQSLTKIRRQSELVENEAKLAHFVEGDRTSQQVSTIDQKVTSQASDKDLENLQRWIAPRHCQEEMEGIELHPGTCEWILERPEMVQWKSSDPDSPQLLWIHGPPGCGKSYIYAKILDHLETTSEKASLYFLFCGADRERTSVSALVRAWASCLASRFNVAAKKGIEKLGASSTQQATEKQVTDLLVSMLECLPDAFLTVDALDECEDRSKLFKLLSRIPRRFKVLITCRYLTDLSKHLELSPNQRVTLEVTPNMTESDINKFVSARIEASGREYPGDIKTLAKAKLVSSDGMFLWVRLMLEQMEEQTNGDEIVQSLVSGNLPTGLAALYDGILDRINALCPAQKLLAHKVLFWVNVGKRPLRAKEIDALLAITLSETDADGYHASRRCLGDPTAAMLSVCGSLIAARGERQVFYPTHFTVTEYIRQYMGTDAQFSAIATYYASEAFRTNHALASAVCMRYLQAFCAFGIKNSSESGGKTVINEDTPEFHALKYSFFCYESYHEGVDSPDDALEELRRQLQEGNDPGSNAFRLIRRLIYMLKGQEFIRGGPFDTSMQNDLLVDCIAMSFD